MILVTVAGLMLVIWEILDFEHAPSRYNVWSAETTLNDLMNLVLERERLWPGIGSNAPLLSLCKKLVFMILLGLVGVNGCEILLSPGEAHLCRQPAMVSSFERSEKMCLFVKFGAPKHYLSRPSGSNPQGPLAW
jgi:hypothetical protein